MSAPLGWTGRGSETRSRNICQGLFSRKPFSIQAASAIALDLLLIETHTGEVRGASLVIAQRILRNSEPLVTADVRVAAIIGGRPARIPDGLRAILAPPELHSGAQVSA